MEKRRLIEGFVVAPLVVPLILSIPELIKTKGLHDFLNTLVAMSLVDMPFVYVFTIALGLPAWFLFKTLRIRSWVAFALGGAVIGALVDVVVTKLPAHTFREWGWDDCYFILAAMCSALIFRAIAGQTIPRRFSRRQLLA